MTDIRPLKPGEEERWLELRYLLWPALERDLLRRERDEILADPDRNAVLVAERQDHGVVGFVEVSLREWAEGCESSPVGYLEGWYVLPDSRLEGTGRLLVAAAEDWARSKGCSEFGSDAELWNEASHQAHAALGFHEVLRLVLFSKQLSHATSSKRT